MRVLIILLLSEIALTSCVANGIAYEFYVVIKPQETMEFLQTLKTLAVQDGFDVMRGRVIADTGRILNIVRGQRFGIMLWAQNMPLSGEEDWRVCGSSSEPRPDPSQYKVFTQPTFFGSKKTALKLGERLQSQLHTAGFEIVLTPAICGAAAIRDRSQSKL